jgi:hypothetical protein
LLSEDLQRFVNLDALRGKIDSVKEADRECARPDYQTRVDHDQKYHAKEMSGELRCALLSPAPDGSGIAADPEESRQDASCV